MVEAPGSPVARSAVIDSMLKSKGLNMIDDLDAPEKEPLLELQAHHDLVFVVEMCNAQRPSKLGSLKGSHEKYEETLSRVEGYVEELKGDGNVSVTLWEPGMPMVVCSSIPPPAENAGARGGQRSRPQSAGATRPHISRPQSAAAGGQRSQNDRLRAMLGGNAEPPQRPRIGAFEVSYKLLNTNSGKIYGPVEVFSKIKTGQWPGEKALLHNRVQQNLQHFLRTDMGDGMLFQHAQAMVANEKAEARPKTVLQSVDNIPDEPPAAPTAASDVTMKTT